jgi:hypothetical protein
MQISEYCGEVEINHICIQEYKFSIILELGTNVKLKRKKSLVQKNNGTRLLICEIKIFVMYFRRTIPNRIGRHTYLAHRYMVRA